LQKVINGEMMSKLSENRKHINNHLASVLDRNRYFKVFIWASIFVLLFIFFFSLPTVFPKTSKIIFGGEQIFAVPFQSRVENNRVYKKIVWINDLQDNSFYYEQFVVVYDDWTDSYWVEKVIEVSDSEEKLIVTHNGTTLRVVDYQDVHGEFVRESGFIGNIYFFVSRPFGILIMGSAMIISLGIYYFGFIRPVRYFNKKFRESYLDE